MVKLFSLIVFLGSSLFVVSQTDTVSLRKNAINIYLESVSNTVFIKENIKFVNYVRDIKNADVIILQNIQSAGNGGSVYTYFFTGNNEYTGKNDTLKLFTTADNSNDEIRTKQVEILKLGLIQYVSHSDLASSISINFNNTELETEEVEDNWKSWIFRIDTYGNSNGEQHYKNFNIQTSISVNKITEKFKIEIEYNNNFYQEFYYLEDQTVKSKRVTNYFRNLLAAGIGEHFAVGFSDDFGNRSYDNKKLFVGFWPTVEYNIFPYSESNVKQLRFQYLVGSKYYQYFDTTIFNKTEELLFNHRLAVAFQISKPWGSINTSISAETYLHDFTKNRFNFDNSLRVRIFKGFTVNFYGSYSIIHDQIYLPKENLSYEEILLRQQQNATSFSYWFFAGFSYTFGSIYNNIVNPRFNDIY